MKEFKDLKIAVAGTGYVGLSLAVLLAQHHQVTALDIVPEKVEMDVLQVFCQGMGRNLSGQQYVHNYNGSL